MRFEIEVPLSGRPYAVFVDRGILAGCGERVRAACGGGRLCAVVSDATVAALYGPTLRAALAQAGAEMVEVTVPPGEASKSFSWVEHVCEALASGGLDRTSFLVALGGGVVGDLAGFAAAVFLRGIPYAQVPTTLLAQVDSSVGGKTGVNLACGKNLAGSFHQPRIVIADTATLDTLPERVFREGMAECIKHGVIRDAELAREAGRLAREDMEAFVARNAAIKAAIVAADEHETLGLRALLNFGHTIGHAIEQAAGYGEFLHGEAIAIGMAAALDLSVRTAGLPEEEAAAVLAQIEAAGLPTRLPTHLGHQAILAAMTRDKKFRDGAIRFVLTRQLGTACIEENFTADDIATAIQRRTAV